MIIDITELNQALKEYISIDQDIALDYTNSDIKGLKNLHISGFINMNADMNIELDLILKGTMIIEDAISLDEIDYDFSSEIKDEIVKNEENLSNILDLSEILCQNIVLEVPLGFSKVKNLEEFKGEGWELLREEDLNKSNNPFEDLKSMFGEE